MLKCSELEAKLASVQFHSTVDNRDKDEVTNLFKFIVLNLKI
jgi:hypothetical protein